jgi:predicted RND superfamily exporter protein
MLAAIVVLCAVAQRSPVLLGLNLLALALAFCLFLGLLLITGAALTPLSLISIPLLIGLAIDYSLHILMGLEHERGDLLKTYDHLAAPVLLTGLSASIGFGVPMLTSQPALQNFGLVMDLGVVSSVVACLVFLPCVYRLCRPAKRD